LVFNSWGLLLATHQGNEIDPSTDTGIHDIDGTTEIIENQQYCTRIKNTDVGREIQKSIEELTVLHDAYKNGTITQELT